MSYIQDKLDDVRNQIMIAFKHLEHGVSFFNGIPVMEDSEEESMNQIIDEALKQSLTDYHNHIIEILNRSIDGCDWCDIEDGKGRYVNEKQLAKNILSLLQDTNPNE